MIAACRPRVWSATAMLVLGCRSEAPTPPPAAAEDLPGATWRAPAPHDVGVCVDLRDVRVCWSEGRPDVRPLDLPDLAPPDGLRCFGAGLERRCASRRRDAPPFRCVGGRCEQPHPRLPDDGEWECADLAGAVSCKGGERAAGLPPGGGDAAFVCGARRTRGGGAPTGERVCVDYSPDLPTEGGPFRCRFETRGGTLRVCEAARDARGVSDPCEASRPCVSGLTCVSQRCVPPAPAPECWLDTDCGAGVPCRFGVCLPGAP